MKAAVAIGARDRIGEGPTWDAAGQRLLWCDMENGIVHEARLGARGEWRESNRWNLQRTIAAAIPRSRGGLVIAGGTDFFMLDEAGTQSAFASLDVDPRLVRLNDAKCDPQGRLWAGTLAHDFAARGALYRIDPDGTVSTMLEGLAIANGMGWNLDGSIFYFTESLSRRVEAFEFDPVRGTIAGRRTFVEIAYGEGGPNGLTVDREDCVWVAVTGSGEVRRYSSSGDLLMRVAIGTPGATSCAFAGPECDTLAITSLGRRMPDVARTIGLTESMMTNEHPESGALFACRPGAAGKPAAAFAG